MTRRKDIGGHIMTMGEVKCYFDVTAETIRTWVKSGKLPAIASPNKHLSFDRKSVEAVPASFSEAARFLGVTPSTVTRWVDARILPEIGETLDGRRRIEWHVVVAFSNTLISGMNTLEVAQLLGVTEKAVRHWANEGTLAIKGKANVRHMRFDWETVKQFADKREAQLAHDALLRVNEMSRREVAEYFRVTITTLSDWVLLGKLSLKRRALDNSWRFDKAEVKAYGPTHLGLTIAELAVRLEVRPKIIRDLTKTGKLSVIAKSPGGALFLDYHSVAEALAEYRKLANADTRYIT